MTRPIKHRRHSTDPLKSTTIDSPGIVASENGGSSVSADSTGAIGHFKFSEVSVQPQPKLIVSQPADEQEQEAERAADEVLASPTPARRLSRVALTAPAARGIEEGGDVSSVVDPVLRQEGRPLDDEARGFMESRFGHDFSQVRIHADGEAARSAEAVNARAYTQGPDIVFGTDQYAPGSPDGRHLLAHELTHTIQQGASKPMKGGEQAAPVVSNVGVSRSSLVQRDTAPPPPMPDTAETFTLTLTDGVHANVSKADALGLLGGAAESLQRGVDQDSGYWAEVNKGRLSFFGAIGARSPILLDRTFQATRRHGPRLTTR